ncbi:MAG: hypothetical protein M3173_05270 [Chloroflexota bacterium]|nr:hypothetical protein [Chloroflexota bacterium]
MIPVSDLPAIVLANEPRAYRQALAAAMRAGRHGIQVITVDAEDLDAAMERHRPVLVVCGAVTPAVEKGAPVWVLLYPDGVRLVVTSVHGVRSYAADISLEALGGLVDQALVGHT